MNKTPKSSSSGKKKLDYQPLFDRDPVTGKLIPLPLPEEFLSQVMTRNARDKTSSEKKPRRKTINLQPLVLTEADFEERPLQKKQKLNTGSASKILQKSKTMSETFGNNAASYKSTTKNTFRKVLSLQKPIQKTDLDQSPLINLEEVENDVINTKSAIKGFPFRSLATAAVPSTFNFSKDSPKTVVSTPSRMSSIAEENNSDDTFLENEKSCLDSPLISKNNVDDLKIMSVIIDSVIKKEQEAFEKYTKVHEENMKQLRTMLNTHNNKTDKENVNGKLVTTPNSVKNENLRKRVLKKNLQSEAQSPRTRSAFSLYNSLRSKNPVLETPQLTRNLKKDSPGKILSDALMKQCMLLQATPVRNK